MRRIETSWFGLLIIALTMIASGQSVDTHDESPVAALVLIDIQNFYFPGGRVELMESREAALHAEELLRFFRRHKLPVFHVKHLPAAVAGSQQAETKTWQIHRAVKPLPGETIVVKHHVNAFRGTRLYDSLTRCGTKRLVICGMQTHMCLEAAARAAADHEFEVVVAGDASATRDLTYQSLRIPAAQVHASTLATIQGAYGRVLSVEMVINELDEQLKNRPGNESNE